MEMLRHVLWIGGTPGSGKTAVATRLARRHGLRWYGSDTRTWRHRDRALRAGSAAARRWETMPPEQRWRTSPAEMLDMSLHAERGPMVVDDLRGLPRSPLVVAEGTALPARAVSDGVADRARAVWLIPSDEVQHARLLERGTPPGPLSLYLQLAETISREAWEHAAPVLRLDESMGIETVVAAVEELFADALAEGPRAETTGERRALLREANEAVVAQVRDYHARPWAKGDADTVVREFLCECGDLACEASVLLRVGTVGTSPALASGH
jgi:hypothetical protein